MASSSVKTIAAAALMAVAGIAGASAEDWKCYTYQAAPASPVNVGLKKMADDIGAVTKGRVSVKCSVGGALPIDANSIAPAVSDGVLDFVSIANISGYVPLAAMGGLPGLFGSNAEFDAKGWPVLKPIIEAEFDKRGIKLLGVYHYPPQVVFGAKGAPPLKALSDLKGKTLRIGNPEQGDLAKALGAIPVTLPTPERFAGAATRRRPVRDHRRRVRRPPVARFLRLRHHGPDLRRDELRRDRQEALGRALQGGAGGDPEERRRDERLDHQIAGGR